MTYQAVLLGSLFGFGAFLLVRALTGTPSSPTTDTAEPNDSAPRPLGIRFDRFDRIGLRVGAATVAALTIGVLTGWPVGVLLAGAGGFLAPSLLGGKARRDAERARLEAIATWTEQLRDVMAAAAGLEQALVATARHAPPPIREDVAWLAASLEAGMGNRTALRRFAQRLDDPAGDLVVAALILAAEGSPRQVGDLLGRLAATTREMVKMRLRIETGRARTRSSVKLVTSITVLLSLGIVVFNPTYVEAYRSAVGQVVLVGVAAFFAGAYWWLARAARPSTTGRFLAAGAAPTHVQPPRPHVPVDVP
jgi:Flp pilus assembly protein TadB